MDLFDYTPTGKINQKHLLTLKDYSREEIYEILHLAIKLKKEYKQGITHDILKGKTLAMIFAKPSTRTRVSFFMAMKQLGGDSLFYPPTITSWAKQETIGITAKVISRWADGIIKTTPSKRCGGACQMAPVVNGRTDDYHPARLLPIFLRYTNIKAKSRSKCLSGRRQYSRSHVL